MDYESLPDQTEYQATEQPGAEDTQPKPYFKVRISGSPFDSLDFFLKGKSKEEVYHQNLPISFCADIPPRLFLPSYLDRKAWVLAARSAPATDRFVAYAIPVENAEPKACVVASLECCPFPGEELSLSWVTGTIARVTRRCNADVALIVRYNTDSEKWETCNANDQQWRSLTGKESLADQPPVRVIADPHWQTEYRVGSDLNDLRLYLSGWAGTSVLEFYRNNDVSWVNPNDHVNLADPPNAFPAPNVSSLQVIAVRYGPRSEHLIAYAWDISKRKIVASPTNLELPAWNPKTVSLVWETDRTVRVFPTKEPDSCRIIRFKKKSDSAVWQAFDPNTNQWEDLK